ncbi:hypothetical protein Ndes2526B_g09094 [Nannochloris sp. 'desiccata']|nr:hypothetical protein KSW81_001358 [Chlorella desiccata (nom. nud.)]KAH7616988.1 hypothetical protein NADE_001790 [Chlorella desiccata (nom. nud.)]
MPVQDIIGMEATFEEDQQQTTFTTELTDAPGPEMAAADSFFDDDGFGDFEDAAWETSAEILSEASTRAQKMESVPPAAPATVSTPTAVNKNDIRSLDPAAFLDAATTTMARFSPLNKGTSSDTRNRRSGSIATLKDLENKFPPLGQNVDGSFSSRKSPSSSSSSTWEGSISQARLLHRLNLGPAPVISSLLLSQPPATRAASLRPSSSGSLYGSTVAPPPIAAAAAAAAPPPFPPPPAKQQRSVLAPPPPPPPQQQQQTKIMEAPLEPEPDPIVNPIVDPFASSGTAGLVDLISPAAEAPRHSVQPRANGFEELTLPEPAQALVEPPAIELERQQQQQQQEEEDKEEELRITNNENADSAFFSAANPPPYQEPFMSSRKEDHNDVALVVADEADNQEDASFNPFIVAGEEDEEKNVLERNEIEGPVVQVATGVVEEERKEEIKEVEVEKEGEMVETEDSFDAFEDAPAAGGGGGGVFGIEECVTPFEVADKEKDMDDAPVAVVQDEHEAQAVEEEEEEEEEEVKLEESKEDFDEFEWAEADSPSVDSIGRTDAVEDIDAPLGNHRVVAPPVVEVAEEKEEAQRPVGEEPVVAAAAAAAAVPLNEEIDREQEGQQRESAVKVSVVEQEATTEDDDFDDFCEAEDAPIVEQKEEEGEKAGVQTAAEVAEGLAATLPDLSFMLSDSLVKPNS